MVLTHPHVAAYFERLVQRPSYKRVIAEAQPHFHLFPYQETIAVRFREVGQSAL
jgi:glutathione S-transferase